MTNSNVPKNKTALVKNTSRNHYIDVLKGIAILSVVFIHTAFHSGTSYVPTWFANFTLLFEVPIFFFLAGWSYSYTKSNRNYFQGMVLTQIKYMLFMLLIFIAINISNYLQFSNNPVTIENLLGWFFHTYTSTEPLPSVRFSLWFFRVYFYVSLLGAMLITILKPNIRKYIIAICFIGTFLISFFEKKIGNINIGIELSYLLFYLFFYLLGYHTKDKKLSLIQFPVLFLATLFCLIVIGEIAHINITTLQDYKFPPNFIYMLWSLFGVYFVLFFKNYYLNCKENFFSKIGQNSIYIFFAQGIGASVLFWVSSCFSCQWYYKIWIMFGINLLVTALVTILLKFLFDRLGKWIQKFLKEKIWN